MGRNRAFQVALAVSAVFHLSMVTVFSIQIPFTRPVVVYYPFDIVDPYTFEPVFRPSHTTLRAPELADLFHASAEISPRDSLDPRSSLTPPAMSSTRFAGLPTVELPQLDYANLDLMAIREMQHELGRSVDAARARSPALNLDRQLDRLADTLIRQPLLEGFDGEARVEAAPVLISQTPAPGFLAEIEWLAPPANRAILFAPPIESLTGQFTADFTAPLAFDLVVASSGQVVVVRAPVQLDTPTANQLEAALERWRFDPIAQEGSQAARLTLRRADGAP